MVSWRIWIYVPLLFFLVFGWYFRIFYLITIPLLVYGLLKIFFRSCWRKYVTFTFALALNIVLIFKLSGSTISSVLLGLMVLEVI